MANSSWCAIILQWYQAKSLTLLKYFDCKVLIWLIEILLRWTMVYTARALIPPVSAECNNMLIASDEKYFFVSLSGPRISPSWSPGCLWPGELRSHWRKPGPLCCGDWDGGWRVWGGRPLSPPSTSNISGTMGGTYQLQRWTRSESTWMARCKCGCISSNCLVIVSQSPRVATFW